MGNGNEARQEPAGKEGVVCGMIKGSDDVSACYSYGALISTESSRAIYLNETVL